MFRIPLMADICVIRTAPSGRLVRCALTQYVAVAEQNKELLQFLQWYVTTAGVFLGGGVAGAGRAFHPPENVLPPPLPEL